MHDLLAALVAVAQPAVVVVAGGDATAAADALRRITGGPAAYDPRVVIVGDDIDDIDDTLGDVGSVDLAWIAGRTPTDDVRRLSRLVPIVRPGGLVVVDAPMTAEGRTPLWEELCGRLDETYEVLTIPGPTEDAGLGILRMRTDDETRFRTSSFEDEMLARGEAPVRFDAVGVGDGRRERVAQQALVNVMSDTRARAVYGCVCAGISSMADIATRLDMTSRDVAKVIARLVSAGLVDNRDGLRDDPTAWQRHARHDERSMRGLTTASITDPEVVSVIARQFRTGRTYTEAQVSAVCREFTDDFALLRRALVDAHLLARSDGRYRRITAG